MDEEKRARNSHAHNDVSVSLTSASDRLDEASGAGPRPPCCCLEANPPRSNKSLCDLFFMGNNILNKKLLSKIKGNKTKTENSIGYKVGQRNNQR